MLANPTPVTRIQQPTAQATVPPSTLQELGAALRALPGGCYEACRCTDYSCPVCVRNGRAKCSRCRAVGAGIRHLDEVLCTDCYDAAEEAAAMAQRDAGQTPAQAMGELVRYHAAQLYAGLQYEEDGTPLQTLADVRAVGDEEYATMLQDALEALGVDCGDDAEDTNVQSPSALQSAIADAGLRAALQALVAVHGWHAIHQQLDTMSEGCK